MSKKKKKKKVEPTIGKTAHTKINLGTATTEDLRKAILDNYFGGEKPTEFKHREAVKFLLEIALFNLDTLRQNNNK
jgi:hypothetical protein